MTKRFLDWLGWKWRAHHPEDLLKAYLATFSTLQGRMVLDDLLSRVYCQVCESHDPIALAAHNAKRALIHDILWNLEQAERPNPITVEETHGPHHDAGYAASSIYSVDADKL